MTDGVDPARFRRSALLVAVLQQLRGEDPDAGLGPDDRLLAREIRHLLTERPAPHETEDKAIADAIRRARRILRRKAKRLVAGREWAQ